MNYPDSYAYDDKFINDMCEMFDGERVDDTILDRSKVTFKTEKLIFDSRYITKYGFFCATDRIPKDGFKRVWRSNMDSAVVAQIVMKKLFEMRDQRDRLQESLTNLLVPDGPVARSIVQGIEQQAEQQGVDEDQKWYPKDY